MSSYPPKNNDSQLLSMESNKIDDLSLLPAHDALWKVIQEVVKSGRLSQAFLLIGSPLTSISFVNRWIAMLICQAQEKPCGECLTCRRLIQDIHPDVSRIQPDGTGSIKIEQIRTLIQDIYQTPQCGMRRYVIIDATEQLNASAANALLKLLEEPPEHAMFFLLAKHLSDLPVTLISRCQRYVVPEAVQQSIDAQIEFQAAWLDDLLSLVSGKRSACVIADAWSKYPLPEVVSWLYLVTATALKILRGGYTSNTRIEHLARACSSETWFKQLDRIHETSKSLHQRISLNTTLTLNYLFMGYCDVD